MKRLPRLAPRLHVRTGMGCASIPRLVEQQAAVRGDALAIVAGPGVISYRELNLLANGVARELLAAGFRRGAHALVRMPRSIELAALLLGVLKAGGSYTWFDSGSSDEKSLSIAAGRHGSADGYVSLDVSRIAGGNTHPSPNLPVLTRGSDIACVLPDDQGSAAVLVPHATITSLEGQRTVAGRWIGEAGAFDLWLGLMTGATVRIEDAPLHAAA